MSGEEKSDPNIAAESGWELHHHSSDDLDHGYFFASDYKESSILSEFGWNIPAESSACHGGLVEFHRIESDWAARSAGNYFSADSSAPAGDRDVSRSSVKPMVVGEKVEAASPSNPSISSSSSEDAPEKSMASGVTSATAAAAANPPSDIASKSKKKCPKQIRQQRFAFVTKSEVDHLEDGYRWRKYGQKAVKNSPFPRSYYRCTNSKCMVKKRIERSSEDPSVVITTYEGQHCHLSAGYPRGGGGGGGGGGLITQGYLNHPSNSQIYHPRFPHDPSQHHSLRLQASPPHVQAGTAAGEASSQPAPVGQGLLGDIVPPRMPWIG